MGFSNTPYIPRNTDFTNMGLGGANNNGYFGFTGNGFGQGSGFGFTGNNYSPNTNFTTALDQNTMNDFTQSMFSGGEGGLLDTAKGILGGLGQLGGFASGFGQVYSGIQNYRLGKQMLNQAKQQFGFEKALANRNLANQAKTINNAYNNAAQVAAGMIGGTDASGNFGFTDPSVVRKYMEEAKKQHVDSTPIK